MNAIASYRDVLNDNMIAAWPRVAAALEGLDCTLMGGTAVAMVLRHRRQGRDYIDIAAMDRAGACTIEDGLRYHRQRYSPTVTYEETLNIAQLATSPPPTDPDPAFDRHLAEAAGHLTTRRRAVLDWALQSGQRPRPPQPPAPSY